MNSWAGHLNIVCLNEIIELSLIFSSSEGVSQAAERYVGLSD